MIVIKIDKENLLDNISDLIIDGNSESVLKKSFSILSFNKKNILRKGLFIGMEICIAIVIVKQLNTITILKEITGVLISVMLAILAIVFTGHAFFQALLNDRLLIALISDKASETNKLAETNFYFAQVMMIQILCLAVNVVVIIVTIVLPTEWSLFSNSITNEIIAGVLILIYFYLNMECVWEMKSFVFNVFQLFNLYSYSRVLNIVNDDDEEE